MNTRNDLAPELFEIIDTEQLQEIVKHTVMRLDEPVMIHGRSGYGKSAVINQVAEEMGAVLVDCRLGQYETVDLRGSLGVGREGVTKGMTVWYPPSTLPFIGNDAFPDDVPIILFLDELTSAMTPVLGVAYQLINDRRIGEHVLKPNVVIICAGNLDDDRGIVVRMPMPVNNRMTHYKLIVSPTALVAYLQSVGAPRTFLGFLQFRKELISTYNPEAPEKVFASPRTIEKAIKYWTDPDLPDWLKEKSIGGACGVGWRRELYAYAAIERNVIPLREILANPTGVPLPDELSLCWATAMNVSGSMKLSNVAPLQKFIARLDVEFQIMIWTLANRRDDSLSESPEFIQFVKRHRDVFSSSRN